MQQVAEVSEKLDPRIRRSRQMLREAVERLLSTKSIDQISVAEIAEEATLNRATFYDHYADKFHLLEDLVESRFQELMSARGVVFDGTCTYALMSITHATCLYLAAMPTVGCARRQMEKYFESAMIAVIRGMILRGLQQHQATYSVPPELIAATISGAIYSGAREWMETPDRVPVEQAVEAIFTLVGPMQTLNKSASGS